MKFSEAVSHEPDTLV